MLLKRCVDIALSFLMLLLLSPLLVLSAVLVWAESGSPVLFRQERVGRNFRTFQILKFRTMQVQSAGQQVRIGGGRRVTKVGRLLRLTKIDEFPQFWNVVRGDMSVVGPRPEVPEYVEIFKDRYRNILEVRPGITDLASIRYRNEEAILARSQDPLREYMEYILPIKLDLAEEYVRKQSVLSDLSIIVQTAVATLFPTAFGQDE
ncbi:MAG: sugar transferase [Terracidiphilus sp.]|jgi:lipopolysaccharide/colanic/teichoic acid biosynthesis glycosyltransferase